MYILSYIQSGFERILVHGLDMGKYIIFHSKLVNWPQRVDMDHVNEMLLSVSSTSYKGFYGYG